MNLIIGYIHDGVVYIATETGQTMDTYSFSDATDTGLSTFFLPGGALCAVTGHALCETVKTNMQWFDGLGESELTKELIVKTIVPKLYDELERRGLIDGIDTGESHTTGAVLLAQKDKLFCIDADFTVYVIPKYCIIGPDATLDFAYPVLALYDGGDVAAMLYEAIEAVRAYTRDVRKPYFLFTTDSTEKKLLSKE